MNVVLLVYVLSGHQHVSPKFPTFFTMYRTEEACERNAKKYMSQNGKATTLVNAVCADARNPALVPYLHDVKEVEDTDTEI